MGYGTLFAGLKVCLISEPALEKRQSKCAASHLHEAKSFILILAADPSYTSSLRLSQAC